MVLRLWLCRVAGGAGALGGYVATISAVVPAVADTLPGGHTDVCVLTPCTVLHLAHGTEMPRVVASAPCAALGLQCTLLSDRMGTNFFASGSRSDAEQAPQTESSSTARAVLPPEAGRTQAACPRVVRADTSPAGLDRAGVSAMAGTPAVNRTSIGAVDHDTIALPYLLLAD